LRTPRGILEEENDKETEENKCPEIDVKLEGIGVRALVDSGSELTCISEFW
jgi:hypothetical protein